MEFRFQSTRPVWDSHDIERPGTGPRRTLRWRAILPLAALAIVSAVFAAPAVSGSGDRAEAAAADGGANLALGKPVRVSSVESNYPPYAGAGAVDGNPTSRWSSEFADNQWLEVDLGARHEIARVAIHWERAFARSYRIEVSDDQQNWREIHSTTDSDGDLDDLTGLSGTGRYIRLYAMERATGWGVSPWEFEVYGATPEPTDRGSNLALGRPVEVSSVEGFMNYGSHFLAKNAVDGDLSTRWSSDFADPQWLTVDLGERFDVDRVVIHWEWAFAKSYKIEVSDDGRGWQEIYATTNAGGGLDELTGLSGTGRYVRLHAVERGTHWGCRPGSWRCTGPRPRWQWRRNWRRRWNRHRRGSRNEPCPRAADPGLLGGGR